MKHLNQQRFSILELIAAIGVTALLMTMMFGLIRTTQQTHLRAQQQSQAIRCLDNTVERLSVSPRLTVTEVERCLNDEFSKSAPLRQHDIEAIVLSNENNVNLVIRFKRDKRLLAQVEVPYAD